MNIEQLSDLLQSLNEKKNLLVSLVDINGKKYFLDDLADKSAVFTIFEDNL